MRIHRCRRVFAVASGLYALIGAAALVMLAGGACRRAEPAGPSDPAKAGVPGAAALQNSESCRECHEREYAAWAGTDHALANRKVDTVADADALRSFAAKADFRGYAKPEMILGHLPLWQPLLEGTGGRIQPHELAYDPKRKEWFNVFGEQNRQPGEWGHWTGRGMNWNSMCAQCHMTGYHKNYDPANDSYHSTWLEQGIGCVGCHGAMPDGHGKGKAAYVSKPSSPAAIQAARVVSMQTCAPCHARNEALTAEFHPGDTYNDHYRVTLPADAGVFWPDGQQRDEVFNWTSVLLSRMGHAGVTCMDCHDPHSTRTLLPADNNALCLQCHAAPGRVLAGGTRAIPIDPVAHSHHADGSAGNRCVDCHMPTTTYMQRAPRHDHGWLRPDPLLTKELGIPNACSRCHSDKPVEWAIEFTDKWFGEKMESRQRARARAVAAAQKGDASAKEALLALYRSEDIPAWKATLLHLLGSAAPADEDVAAAARAALADPDPLVRDSAVQVLTAMESERARLEPLLNDPVRLVRLDAAWALSDRLASDSPVRQEYEAYLSLQSDQPAGRLRLGQDLANRGKLAEAEKEMRTAASWDRNSAGIHEALAGVLSAEGKASEAAASYYRAGELAPSDAGAMYSAGLAYAEAGMMSEAETSLREAARRRPDFDRAWYNLGLLLAQTGRDAEALTALARAEKAAPRVPDYPYAAATIHFRKGDASGAHAAAGRALAADPDYAPARELLQRLR